MTTEVTNQPSGVTFDRQYEWPTSSLGHSLVLSDTPNGGLTVSFSALEIANIQASVQLYMWPLPLLLLVTRAVCVNFEVSIKCIGALRSFPSPSPLSLCAQFTPTTAKVKSANISSVHIIYDPVPNHRFLLAYHYTNPSVRACVYTCVYVREVTGSQLTQAQKPSCSAKLTSDVSSCGSLTQPAITPALD